MSLVSRSVNIKQIYVIFYEMDLTGVLAGVTLMHLHSATKHCTLGLFYLHSHKEFWKNVDEMQNHTYEIVHTC